MGVLVSPMQPVGNGANPFWSYNEECHMRTLLRGDESFIKFCPIFYRKNMPVSFGLKKKF